MKEVCEEASQITRKASKASSSSISSDNDNDDGNIDSDKTFEEYMACYQRKKMATLSDKKRKEFVHDCLFLQEENKLPRGTMDVLQKKYEISERMVRNLWLQVRDSLKQGELDIDLGTEKK